MRGEDIVNASFARPIDLERLAKETGYEVKARKRAALSDLASATEFDQKFSSSIYERLQNQRQVAQQDLRRRVTHCLELVRQHAGSLDFSKIQNDVENRLSEMSINVTSARGDIAQYRQDFVEHKEHYEQFRAERGLRRPPAPWRGAIEGTWILMIFAVLEAFINMFFFNKGSEFGLAGGFLFAIFVALANISICFFIGFFPSKWIHSKYIIKKLVGILLVVAGFFVLIGAHGFVGHVRAQQILSAEQGMFLQNTEYFTNALAAVTSQPLRYPDIESYVLILFGIGFGCFAWYKGYNFGDHYPGFSKQLRDLESRRYVFEAEYDKLFDRLGNVRNDVKKKLDAFIDTAGPRAKSAAHNAQAARDAIENYREFAASIDDAGCHIFDQYNHLSGAHLKWRRATADSIDMPDIEASVQTAEAEAAGAGSHAEAVSEEATRFRRLVIERIAELELEMRSALGEKGAV